MYAVLRTSTRKGRLTHSCTSAVFTSPPRIIDRVVVGDGPEGLAISPKQQVQPQSEPRKFG